MEDGNMAVVLLTLLLFGLAVIPFTYILQSGFSSPATGFVMIIIFSILSGEMLMYKMSFQMWFLLDIILVCAFYSLWITVCVLSSEFTLSMVNYLWNSLCVHFG